MISGKFVKSEKVQIDKVKAFQDLFGPTPDKINNEVEFYLNREGFSTQILLTLKELGFRVGFISPMSDGSVSISEQ